MLAEIRFFFTTGGAVTLDKSACGTAVLRHEKTSI
jgi:hypothetical protein